MIKENIKYNFYNYFHTNSKKAKLISLIILLIILLLIWVLYKTYIINIEVYNATTICEENKCKLEFYQLVEKNEFIDYVTINRKKYNIQEINYANPEIDQSNVVYQKVSIELEKYQAHHNEIVKLNIYKDKEKLYKKILNIILER